MNTFYAFELEIIYKCFIILFASLLKIPKMFVLTCSTDLRLMLSWTSLLYILGDDSQDGADDDDDDDDDYGNGDDDDEGVNNDVEYTQNRLMSGL